MSKDRLYNYVMIEILRDAPKFAKAYSHRAFLDINETAGKTNF